MAKKARIKALMESDIDCACVIHGTAYDWIYVDKLYSMLSRNFSRPVRLHVWTEHGRPVPAPYIKHALTDWPGIGGPRKSWWYKMQMFDPAHYRGRLIYFDLDIVIVANLDWMLTLDPQHFWAVRDFRHLFRGAWHGINSSCMIWHTETYEYVWQQFMTHNIQAVTRQYPGDQDFLNATIEIKHRRYLKESAIKSWRWQVLDGGMDFRKKVYKRPDAGSIIPPETAIMIFHGHPKPHEISDPVVVQNWV